jgi:hypothetical protein
MKQYKEYEEALGIPELKCIAEEAWKKDLRNQFQGVPDSIYELCFQRAWERANDKGHDAVFDDLVYVIEFAEAVLEAGKALEAEGQRTHHHE